LWLTDDSAQIQNAAAFLAARVNTPNEKIQDGGVQLAKGCLV